MVARRGQPNLANDPGYRPDWRERTGSSIEDEKRRFFVFRTTEQWGMLLSRAARHRGMSNSAYVRRAVSAFIASDLQVPFEDVCQMTPGVVHEARTNKGVVWPPDNGKGYGKWEVMP